LTPSISIQTSVHAPRREEAGVWATRAHAGLVFAFLYYTFIGTHPLADTSVSSRVDGSMIDRVFVLSMFALALFVLWGNRRTALHGMIANAPLLAVVSFCMASILWSDYPELTLRRGLLLIFLTTIAKAIAAGLTDLRRFHTLLFAGLTAVVIVNLLATAAAPHLAVTDIGVRGVYTQKNVAGIVAMMTIVIGAAWIAGATGRRQILLAALALAPALLFLVLTRSKTSINLAAGGLAIIAFFAMAERYGAAFILLAASLGLTICAGLLGLLLIIDFDTNIALSSLFGDTTFTGRDELWAFAGREAEKRYWLGHGYGAFWDVGAVNDPLARLEPGTWLASVDIGTINQAHHGYLELWLHIGLPATVAATLTIIHGAALGGWRAVMGRGSRQTRAALGAFAALLLLQLLHNFTEATLFMRGAAFCSMAMLAMFVIARARDFEAAAESRGR